MHLILPVSHADTHLMSTMSQLLQKFGPYRGHIATICPTQDVSMQEAEQFKSQIAPLFDEVTIHEVKVKHKTWPAGPNVQFREVAKYAATRGLPFYFFELDNTPLKTGWLQAFESQYEAATRAGKINLGCIVNSRTLEGDPGPKHMVGTGIYHANFAPQSVKLPTIDVVFMWAQGKMEPFDLSLRDEVVPRAQHTNIIAHRFKTVNYRLEDGVLVCDNMPGNKQDHSGPVPADAVVVHGCKDGSLQKLILSGMEVPKQSPVSPPSTEVAAPGANGVDSSSSTPPEVPAKGATPNFLALKIIGKLKEGKGWRVPALATELQMDEAQIKEVIAEPTSNLEVTKPGGWVRVKAASH